jgi:hypothetical protein
MNDSPDLSRLNIDPSRPMSNEEILRRLIRLVVGLALVGKDALQRQLPAWEAQAALVIEELEKRLEQGSSSEATSETMPESPPSPSDTPWFPKNWEYRLVGLAFESPGYIKSGLSLLWQTQQKAWRFTAPLRWPLDALGVTDMSRQWLSGMIEQIKNDMDRLEAIGESEAEPSRALGYVTINSSYEALLENLAGNPDVQKLIQQQSVGLTEEVIEEVRERTVGIDILADNILRRLLRTKQTEAPPDKKQLGEGERDSSW